MEYTELQVIICQNCRTLTSPLHSLIVKIEKLKICLNIQHVCVVLLMEILYLPFQDFSMGKGLGGVGGGTLVCLFCFILNYKEQVKF